jgi:hypothetical protein
VLLYLADVDRDREKKVERKVEIEGGMEDCYQPRNQLDTTL